jgi:hypothetical protein
MTLLPIVGRELRVASRKRSTFWVRVSAAIVALVIGIGFLIASEFGPGFGTATLGKGLFITLGWLSFAAALSAGLFFTSDCLSEEKREGTLGLLFLTDLAGYDVVIGKLAATSLRALYALLAVFPVLGITLMMGGVTGAQFWKTTIALTNALFVSLAVGLFVSAVSRDSQKVLGMTLLLLLVLALGGPLTDSSFGLTPRRLSLSSPAFVFGTAESWGRSSPFWNALLVNQIIGWSLLAVTCWILPRTWQEKERAPETTQRNWRRWWRFGSAARQLRMRQKFLQLNPVLWLACRERWQSVAFWTLSLFVVFALASTMMNTSGGFGTPNYAWILWSYVGKGLTLVMYLGITSHACRFFVDARRSGLLEVLLATPLTTRQVLRGQWQALLRMFALPLVLFLAAQMFAAVMAQNVWRQTAAPPAAATPVPPATNTTQPGVPTTATTATVVVAQSPAGVPGAVTPVTPSAPPQWVIVAICSMSVLAIVGNLLALVWFGMWTGLISKNTNLATLKTILFVQVIPWFAITFLGALIVPIVLLPKMMGGTSMRFVAWYPLLTAAVNAALYLGKDVGFILWTRARLNRQFRERAAQMTGFAPMPVPPPIPIGAAS